MSSSNESLSPRSSFSDQSTTLESLISHLLASKRSLSSVSVVQQAKDLVTSSRKSLETNVITTARTKFLRSGIDEQVKVLEQVHAGSKSVARKGRVEFENALRTLDQAEQRLRTTLQVLRETFVEAGLRPEGEAKRSLVDFVDESAVETQLTTIQETIGSAGKGHGSLSDTNKDFARELLGVKQLLLEGTSEGTVEDTDIDFSIPEILTSMEDNATEMGENLGSLVKHYDLCVSAIKHTEGGGDAAQRIARSLPEGVDIGETDLNPSQEPISEDERQEIIAIIKKDADQVDEVVNEMRERIAEVEAQEQIIKRHIGACTNEFTNINAAFNLLEDIGHRLPAFIAQSQVFLMRWEEDRSRLEEHMEELEGLREVYDGFLAAYDNLLIEVGRRKTLEARIERVVQEAMSKISKLYDDDTEARNTFKAEQGDFLPADIWPGLTMGPVQYTIEPVGESQPTVPEIPISVIKKATDRVGRGG